MSIERAINDIKRFSQAEFSVEIAFSTPDDLTTSIVKGLATRHHLSFDGITGVPVNTRNAHVSVAESALVAAGYPVRNPSKEVAMTRHKVTWTDATSVEKTYLINQIRPSDTVGLLVFILGEYAA